MCLQLLSDKGDYEEAMETLKMALKLEPSTKVRDVTVSPEHIYISRELATENPISIRLQFNQGLCEIPGLTGAVIFNFI